MVRSSPDIKLEILLIRMIERVMRAANANDVLMYFVVVTHAVIFNCFTLYISDC